MEKIQKTYRIRTEVGSTAPTVLNIPLNQTYDMFEILSLKINQTNSYKTFDSTVGVVVGRVIANGGVGVENAKLSIFIPVDENEEWAKKFIYDYYTTNGKNEDGVRYNLLMNSTDDACHAVVGTFPNKRLVLDNDNYIEIFDEYWKYTTTTNKAGDYMLSGIPVGNQTLHVDVDLSDCGILSQRPRDMIGQGYDEKMFESPNKFKKSTNLDSLVQIITQDKGLYVYPYWGDTSETADKFSITRCDIELTYEFKPTCVFMGSIITDKGSNSIGKNCTAKVSAGDMASLTTGEGTIEMIRKTLDGKVESFSIEGDRLIDSDGVWCYQIPMNLDYVTTNEEGSLVPTDNPEKGIATRAKVRFRIGLSESINDNSPYKKCKYLVPNNPRLLKDVFPEFYSMENKEADYEFGTKTKEESFANLFWNNVYTVKNYIPRLQKNRQATNKKHTGIKQIKYFGDNNPMPYNAMDIKLSFTHRIICVLTKLFIQLVAFLNFAIALLSYLPCKLCEAFSSLVRKIRKIKIIGKPLSAPFAGIRDIFCNIVLTCISLSSEFCDDSSGIRKTYYPGCHIGGELGKRLGLDCVWKKTKKEHDKSQKDLPPEEQTEADYRPNFNPFSNDDKSTLLNCVENSLAQDNDATSFKFQNDWVNGVLYAPLWFRRIRPKKRYLFGLFKRKAKDQWCKEEGNYGLYFYQNGIKEVSKYAGGFGETPNNSFKSYYTNEEITPYVEVKDCGNKCYNSNTTFDLDGGLILTRETMLGHTIYYYKAINYVDGIMDVAAEEGEKGAVELLYATDIVLLGSLNDCDLHGVPQFFKSLDSTTYNMPSDLEFVDVSFSFNVDPDADNEVVMDVTAITEETGADWGNLNTDDQCGKMGKDDDGGLFYDIGCSGWETRAKTAVNLRRICEFGVVIDSSKFIPNLPKLEGGEDADDDDNTGTLRPDGYISYDELQLLDERSMFATMNGNRLRTVESKENGLLEYDFRYLYCDNFDAALKQIMQNRLKKCQNVTYKNNGKLEEFSFDYYMFRMGEKPYFYDKDHTFARYENSFYFYFGLKAGKTAIEKFNTKFFSECEDNDEANNPLNIDARGNDWCSETLNKLDGYVKFDFTGLTPPFDIIINSDIDGSVSWESDNPIEFDKFYFGDENDDTGLFNGYQWVQEMMLPNGEYVITVTDNDGTIVSTKFTLKTKYLSFRTTTTDFIVDNSFLKSFYGFDYNDIANGGQRLESDDENFPFNSRREDIDQSNNEILDIGGVITVYGIFNGGEEMDFDGNEYKITVRPVDSDLYKLEGYNWICIYNGTSSLPQSVTRTTITDINGNEVDTFIIGVPKGDVTYKVTVTQLCNGVDSLNSVTKYLKVAQPIPVKLFVNDVDIDLLKNFNTGWEISSGNMDNSLKFTPNISALCGWNEISNIWGQESAFFENIPNTLYYYDDNDELNLTVDLNDLLRIIDILHTEEIVGSYYHWTDVYLTDFTSASFSALSDGENLLSPLQENALIEIDKIYQKRLSLPNEVRTAFFITCSDSRNGIYAQLQTNNYPINYGINYPEDYMTEDEEIKSLKKNSSDRDNCTREFTEDSSIDGVYIPTLTYTESPDFGGGDSQHSDIARNLSFSYVRNYDEIDKLDKRLYKTPYVIGACDAIGVTKPDGLDLENSDPKKLDVNGGDATKYFMFHLIDKIISMDKIAWSYFDNIPYYNPSNGYSGEFINMNGILAARINNGIAEDLGNNLTQYNRQEYASYNLLIKRFCEDTEDSLPTRRVIMGIDVTNLVESTLDDLGINYDTDEDVDNLIQNIMDLANLNIIASIGLDVIITELADDLNDILNDQLGNESINIYLEFSDEIDENEEIVTNIVSFDLGANVSSISVSPSVQDADWVAIDTSYNSVTFTCQKNEGALRTCEYSITFNNGANHRIVFTLKQDTNGISVSYNDYNGVSHTFTYTDNVTFNVKMTKVESFKELLEEGVEGVIRKYFYPFRHYYVTDRSNFEGCEDEKTNIDMQYSPILRIDEELDISDNSGCSPEEDETYINGKMKVMLADESVNECTTNESGTIFHVTCDDVEEEGRFYLYRLRDGFTYPLNYTQKDDNYTFVNEEIKDAWQNGQNDGFNIFSFATKSTVLEELAKDPSNILIVNGFRYFKSAIIKEEEESTQEETTYGYGNTGVFELTGGTNAYRNFRGQLFIVGETKGHCRALSPVYDFSLVEGALKIGVFYDVESVYVEGVGQTYQQRLNDNNLPLDVLGVSVANRDDLYYFKWYDHDIFFETDVLGTRVISEQGTLKHGISNALLIELNAEMKAALVDKLTNHKREVISMTNLTAVDITTLKHHCLLKEENIGGSSNWFAIVWDLDNLDASWDDGTRGIKKTIYEQGEDVNECPFNVVSPPDNAFLGWSNIKGGSPLPQPYVTNINSTNWPMVLYAIWENGSDVTYYTVYFYEEDETTLIDSAMVIENFYANPPSGHENSMWYEVGDVTKTPIDLSTTPITSDMSLAEIPVVTHTVNWISVTDEEEEDTHTVNWISVIEEEDGE